MITLPQLEEDQTDPPPSTLGGWNVAERPDPPTQVSLDRFKELILDEAAISAAESGHEATLSAAQDLWDDTGWTEPMAEAVAAAFDWAAEEVQEQHD